jgi:DNA-binding response OmpR family regulator
VETTTSILLVDDQPGVVAPIKQALQDRGYRVLDAKDGAEALRLLEAHQVDLILADITMPRMNGYQLHQYIIENPQWITIPFIFLTGNIMDSDIRYGKELGVDDYLTKPVNLADLLATVRGRLRRARQLARLSLAQFKSANSISGSSVWKLGQLKIDINQHRVWLNGGSVKLSAREFKLLKHLAQEANKVVSSQDLIQATHGLKTDHVEAGALLRPLIRSLRRKLGYPAGEMGCIENVRGVGYQLIPPEERVSLDSPQ